MPLKPGPPSAAELLARLDHALRNLDDRIELNRNPLTHLSSVAALAEQRYRGRLHPRALALREIVCRAVQDILADFEDEIGSRRVRSFLYLYASGSSITQAAAELGLSREHCSRTVKRKALLLVAHKFSEMVFERRGQSLSSGEPAVPRAS